MAREAIAQARITKAELAEWRGKAESAGVSIGALIRKAMARTHTWTAPARDIERDRSRELARIGNNLNQIARWANRYKRRGEAVEVLVQLAAIEREMKRLRLRSGGRGASHDD